MKYKKAAVEGWRQVSPVSTTAPMKTGEWFEIEKLRLAALARPSLAAFRVV